MIESLVQFFLNLTADLGYWGILILMTIESSFIPFPSEIVVPPAAYLAFKGEMNIYLIVLFATVGSILGALVNYFLAATLGKKMVYSLIKKPWAKYLLLSEEKLLKSENYFREYGSISTFVGRLIPVVRQLISLPAGFVKMNLISFTFFTALGAFIWVAILAYLGFAFGANQEVLEKYYSEIGIGFLIFGVLVFAFLYFRKKKFH